ncbi:hypothetical protein D3C81_11330 [compost metagenome]
MVLTPLILLIVSMGGIRIVDSNSSNEQQEVRKEEQNGLISDMNKTKTDDGYKIPGAVLIDTSKGIDDVAIDNVSCIKLIYIGSSIRSGYLDFKRVDFGYNSKTKEVSNQIETIITVYNGRATFALDKYNIIIDEAYSNGGLDIRIEE